MQPRDDRSFEPLSNRTYLETPENVRLAFRLAGPGMRLGAYLVDFALRVVIFSAMAIAIGALLAPVTGTALSTGVFYVLAFVLEWGYGCFFETWWNGQTPGKRIFGLRVIKTEGYSISFYDAMLRNLLRAADFFPLFYAAGFIAAASTSRMQRIGDLVAGTMVIRERRLELKGEIAGLASYEPFPMNAFEHRYRPAEKTLEAIEALFSSQARPRFCPARRDRDDSRRADGTAALILRPKKNSRANSPPSSCFAF